MFALDNKRKHRKQMSPDEIAVVEKLVRSQTRWTLGPHARDRMVAKGVDEARMLDVLKTGYVIEVNRNNDLCVVFRKDFNTYAICVVVSLATRWVVTVWKNGAKDKHYTLDRNKYQWAVNLQQEMAAFIHQEAHGAV